MAGLKLVNDLIKAQNEIARLQAQLKLASDCMELVRLGLLENPELYDGTIHRAWDKWDAGIQAMQSARGKNG